MAQSRYLEQNYSIIEAAIIENFQSVGIEDIQISYKSNGVEGAGIYATVQWLDKANIQISEDFFYLESQCTDIQAFLDDLNTDIGIFAQNYNYGIHSYITEHGSDSSCQTSFHDDIYHGYKGLSRFWNVRELQFDWQKFNEFVSEKNQQKQSRSLNSTLTRGFVAKGNTLFQPKSMPTGIETMSFQSSAKELAAKLLGAKNSMSPP